MGRLSFWQPLAARDFRLLFSGESISMAGSQFTSVAVAWLGYKVTGSGLALGSVFIVGGLPRLILMLLGGAVTDRFSPWRVLTLTNVLFGLTSGTLAVLAFSDVIQLWHLYVASFLFGAGGAFAFPATFSIIPRTLATERLNAGNALMESANALTSFLGPSLAGIMIAFSGRTRGTGISFTLDASSFFFAFLMLLLMSQGAKNIPVTVSGDGGRGGVSGLLLAVREGMQAAWQDTGLRTFLLLLVAGNLAFYGPYRVGLAALAVHRFPEGAGALGALYGAWGAGALVGTVLAGFLQGLRRYGLLMLVGSAAQGIGFVLIGFAPGVVIAVALVALIGVEGGVGNVVFGSWLQARTAPEMLGRVMSLVGIANVGLTPVSYALSGVLVDVDPTLTFLLAGGLVLLVVAGGLTSRTVRTMS
jgi:Transmembrane secretion effector